MITSRQKRYGRYWDLTCGWNSRLGLMTRRRAERATRATSLCVEPLEDRRLLDASVEWSTYLMDQSGVTSYGATDVAVNQAGSIFVATSPNISYVSDSEVTKISADGQTEIWRSFFNKDVPVRAIAIDVNDNVYLAGSALGRWEPHVTKLDATGARQWSWSLDERNYHVNVEGVAVDVSGEYLYVTGGRGYHKGNTSHPSDIFLVKLRIDQADGPELIWSKTYGGSSDDYAIDITLDSFGNVILAGSTHSVDFPVTTFDTEYGGDGDLFVMKLDAEGVPLWSTFLGGAALDGWYDTQDNIVAVAVDSNDDILVGGSTRSEDLLTSASWRGYGFDVDLSGESDAFAAKLSEDGEGLWATYLGGGGEDIANDLALDQNGNVLVTGTTQSEGWVSGGFDLNLKGEDDAFVAQLSADGGHVWSSYLGGDGSERSGGIVVDPVGDAVVVGKTRSSGWIAGGYDEEYNGGTDGFVAKIRLGPPPGPSFSIDDVEVAEGDSGTTIAAFTVTRSGDTSAAVSVEYTTADGAATAGSDYTTAEGTLNFASGEVSKTINVAVLGDDVEELDETFYVDLSNANGATIADPQAFATIIDDDAVSALIDVYIADIRFESKRGGHDWRAVVEVLTVDGDAPVEGVTLKVDFALATYTLTTDSSGIARTSWERNLAAGSYTTDAYDVALEDPDFFWTPFAFDHETDSDGDGKPDDLLEI